jgi:hypothetical protein
MNVTTPDEPQDPQVTAWSPNRDCESALPAQSLEDTDAGWGEQSEPDDERLYRDRPPHWDSA